MPISSTETAASRRQSLVIAISCIVAFGAGIGLVWPLRALILESRGVEASINGLNSGAAFLGVIFGPLLAPAIVRRVGLRPFLLGCLSAHTVLLLLLKVFEDIAVWFVLCVGMGVAGSGLITATEAWITTISGNEERGRVVALYAAALSIGLMIGPLILSATGVSGWAPFFSGTVLNGLAALPLFFARGFAPGFGIGASLSLGSVVVEAPTIVLAVVLFGFYEAAAVTILPVWGVRLGLDPRTSAALLSALYLGSIVLQWPIGVLSDRISRLVVLRLCAVAGILGAIFLPFVAAERVPLFVVIAVWGGFSSAIYPVALSMAGDRFRGTEMVVANAVLVMGYGIGSSLGPMMGGFALDLWSPHGISAEFVVLFTFFLALTVLPTGRPALQQDRP